jgi:aspartyl-tRNA(Asn)/glutamyl-tRNA(Gln) amidotransferase subunit A
MNDDILYSSISALGKLLRERKISSLELTRACLERLETLGPKYNALATLARELAEKQARESDDRLKRRQPRGPLEGIPYGVKDLLATQGIPTTWGSEPFRDQVFDYDATVIRKLRDGGGVLAAKLAMVPLAGGGGYRYSNPHLFGTCKNPWNPEHWAGGSSSGPTAAVSAAMVPFAIGSETGGSIVVAAAYTGITAVRPTYGLVSRHGAMALSWTLDKLGPMCHSSEDCALVLGVIAGDDPKDPSSSGRSFVYRPNSGPPLREIRIGYFPTDFSEQAVAAARPAFQAAIDVFRKMGIKMVEMALPQLPYRQVSGVIAGAEVSTAFAPLIHNPEKFNLMRDERQKSGLRNGLSIPATRYLQATRIRRIIQERIREFYKQVDVVICFTERNPAPRIDSEAPERPAGAGRGAGAAAAARGAAGARPAAGNTDLMGCSNLLGLPGITLPCGLSSGLNLPLGLHLVGRPFEEQLLFQLGNEFQKITDWHLKRPPMGRG